MTDSTPKQRKNEEKFLKPALGELQPYYADLFDCIMRGKKRGDGLMIDPDRKKEIESHVYDLENTRKDERREIKKEERRKIYEQETNLSEDQYMEEKSYGTTVVSFYDMAEEPVDGPIGGGKGLISKERRNELEDILDERVSQRSDELTQITDKDMFLSEAYYIMNTIGSHDRGTRNAKARSGSIVLKSPVMMEKRGNELRAVAEVFENYRSSTENPDVTANKTTINVAKGLYGSSIAESMERKKKEQQEFVNQEVIV